MKIAICDDEKYFIEIITNYCKRFSMEFKIPFVLVKFTKGANVLTYYKKYKDIDLFILDIMMPEVDGVRVAEEIRKEDIKVKIVFLTAALEFAPIGYVIGINRYWLKPVSYEKFSSDLLILCKEVQKENGLYIIEQMGTSVNKVYFDEIFYIETSGRKICVHKEKTNYMSNMTLTDYEKKLDQRFFRCHAAYIVNMSYISKIVGLEIILWNGEFIYMSKGRKKKFLSTLSSFLNNEMKDIY